MNILSAGQPPLGNRHEVFTVVRKQLNRYSNYEDQCINISLANQYMAAMNQYCTASNVTIEPLHPLRHPLSCFYKRGKSYYLTFSFKNPNSIRQNFYHTLNRKCWHALFTYWKFPIQGYEYYVQNLYSALITLLEHQRLSRLDTLLQRIIVLHPKQGNRLYYAIHNSLQTLNGLLLLRLENLNLKTSSYQYAPWSEGLLRYHFFYDASSFPSGLLRSLFREFRLSTKPCYGPLPFGATFQGWPDSITYVISEHLHRISPPLTENQDGFLFSYSAPVSAHSEKTFAANPIPPESIPANAELLLYMLTGGSLKRLNRIATLFFEIMANRPTMPNMTVLYSPLNATRIQVLFYEIFKASTAFYLLANNAPLRLSTLVQKKWLMALAEENVYGRALLQISDAFPSEEIRPTCRKLMKGDKVKLSDTCADGQHFRNNIHFLCITDNKKKADALAREFSAPLIDLSADEQMIPPAFSLASEDINWLKTSFALHGLFLRLMEKYAPDDCDNTNLIFDTYDKPTVEESLHKFVDTCCISDGGCVTGVNLYCAYSDYYKDVHDCPPPYTKIVFIKMMRDYWKDSKKVVYKKSRKRIPPNQAAPFQFLGISLRENWQESLPKPNPFGIPHLFHAYLCAMNKNLLEEFVLSADSQALPAPKDASH